MSHRTPSAAARRHGARAAVRRHATLLAAALLVLSAPGSLRAQATGTITGRVRTANTGAPLGDVAIRLEGSRGGALSDESGRFRIERVPAGTATLLAQRVGYAPERVSVAVAPGDTTDVEITLHPAAVLLQPVVVSATREAQRRADASATIDVLDGAVLRRAGAAHPSEIANRLPGVHVAVTTGEGHMTAIRQPITTKPVYLYLEDGVPTRATGFFNHNALYEVNLPQAGGIEVLKGPGTALYGSDAIGGVINVLTRPAPAAPSLDASVEGGANGWGRLLLTGGTTRGDDGVRADLNLTRSDGWRDGSTYTRQSGTVRWDRAGSAWTARTVLTGSNIRQHDVFTLDQAHFDIRSPLNRSPITYRTVQALRLSSALERSAGPALWSITPYARYDVLDLMPYWQLTYDPQLWSTRNTSLGVLAKYRRDLAPLQARVIAGADADWSPGRFRASQVISSPAGPDRIWASYTTGALQYDYDVTYRALSPYAQVELSPVPRVRVDLGARLDLSGYAYHTRLPADETTDPRHRRPADTTLAYRQLSPKVGVTVDLGRGANVFASYRRGFRAPSQDQLFRQGSALNTVGLRPVTVGSWETGVRGDVGGRVLYELSLYDMTIRNDILTFTTPENTRQAVNAGASRYQGIEVGVGAALTSALRLDASYALSRQRYVRYVPQAARPAHDSVPATPAVDYSGNRVEQAPRDLASVVLGWAPAALRGGRMEVEYAHTGRYFTDAANTHTYGGYGLVHLRASARVAGGTELFARVINLFDRRYAELVSYDPFQGSQYTPGTPRAVYAGVRYLWER